MSDDQNRFFAALALMETGLTTVATGHSAYRQVYTDLARACAFKDRNRAFSLDQAIGPQRVNELVVRRMRALGLSSALNHARANGDVNGDLTEILAPNIYNLVR